MTKNRTTARRRGFTITELLVVIVTIAAMLAIQIPTDAAARRTARRMQNSTQLRGIHQGLVTYANSNRNLFAGLDARGNAVPARDTGGSGTGENIQARYWLLLDGDYFTPEYCISPSEVANVTEYDEFDNTPEVRWSVNGAKEYSYAMLQFSRDANAANPLTLDSDTAPRSAEWSQTLNSQAIVVSDRNTGTDATRNVRSIHDDDRGEWSGSVLWNDNHVAFESSHYFETKYANGRLNSGEEIDNIFHDEPAQGGQITGANALMAIADDDVISPGE